MVGVAVLGHQVRLPLLRCHGGQGCLAYEFRAVNNRQSAAKAL